MVCIKAHFDGKVIVPNEPVDLPTNQVFVVRIDAEEGSALEWLAEHAVDSAACPPDLSEQHDHYLYGSAKRGLGR